MAAARPLRPDRVDIEQLEPAFVSLGIAGCTNERHELPLRRIRDRVAAHEWSGQEVAESRGRLTVRARLPYPIPKWPADGWPMGAVTLWDGEEPRFSFGLRPDETAMDAVDGVPCGRYRITCTPTLRLGDSRLPLVQEIEIPKSGVEVEFDLSDLGGVELDVVDERGTSVSADLSGWIHLNLESRARASRRAIGVCRHDAPIVDLVPPGTYSASVSLMRSFGGRTSADPIPIVPELVVEPGRITRRTVVVHPR